MKQAILGVWMVLGALILAWPSYAGPTPVGAVMGGNVACEPTIPGCQFFPTSASILCNGSGANLDCPQYFHPDWSQSPGSRFFGITNRTNPPRYLTSTTGSVWTLTTVQPFTAAVLNSGSYMAVASDGSVLAASGQGANTCLIRRSTDQGASWSTVFSSLVQTCSIVFGQPTPPGMYCAETGGYCAVINMTDLNAITMIFSTDNGLNWTIGVPFVYLTSNSRTWGPILAPDGGGIIIRGSNATTGQPFGSKQAADFTFTPNFIPPVNLNCRPFTMGNSLRAFCAQSAGGNTGRIYTGGNLGIVPTLHSTFTIPDALGIGQDFQPAGFNDTYGYAVALSFSPANLYNVYITADGATSFILLSQLTPTTAPVANCCRGNLMRWGNKMYFTTSATASQAIFGVIQ